MTEMQDVLLLQQSSKLNGEAKSEGESGVDLAGIIAQATLKYSVKDYDAAAELYSQATELQAEINGEMSPENADLLYAYGRCLYHVAVKKSDVLGSKVAGVDQAQSKEPRTKKAKKKPDSLEALDDQGKRVAEEVVAKVVEEKDGSVKPDEESEKSKPYFQFTGDENWDSSDNEEDRDDQDGEDGAEDDEEDDFVNAYEVLDLARVLLLKKIEEAEERAGKETKESQGLRQLKERLADTFDLQAEISLEGERFPTAVVDLKSALELKCALYPQESSLLAEAHYKLSLALEFSSVTQQKDANGEDATEKEAHVDEAMREEAASEMEAAIASCKLRIQKEEITLSAPAPANRATETQKVTKADIEDVKEMVKEMEQRVSQEFCHEKPLFANRQIAHRVAPASSISQRPNWYGDARRLESSERHSGVYARRESSCSKGEARGGFERRKRFD